MNKIDNSFMSSIDAFDNCLKQELDDEVREYAEAMRDFFTKLEIANVNFNRTMNKIIENASKEH